MDFRHYDAAIGRFTAIDPVTHYSQSTYAAFDNNPVYWADPSGADSQNFVSFMSNEDYVKHIGAGGKIKSNFHESDYSIIETKELENKFEGNSDQQDKSPKPKKIKLKNSSKIEVLAQFIMWYNYIDLYAYDENIYPEDVIDFSSSESPGILDARSWTMTGGFRDNGYKDEGGSVRLGYIHELGNLRKNKKYEARYVHLSVEELGYEPVDSRKEYMYRVVMQDGGTMLSMRITGKDLKTRIEQAVKNGGFFQINDLKK